MNRSPLTVVLWTVLEKSLRTQVGNQETNGLRRRSNLKLVIQSLLKEAKSYLGTTGRPNKFTEWYADKVKDTRFRTASWCAMFISYVADKAKVSDVVGSFAYTPYWVDWFKKHNQWGMTPKVGAIVFFDWDYDLTADHVGVVQAYNGRGEFYTIEGNKSDSVQRVHRDMKYVLGFGYPKYPDMDVTPEKPKPVVHKNVYTVREGDTLSSISRLMYGKSDKWDDIYKANRRLIGDDPDLIRPGQRLVIP